MPEFSERNDRVRNNSNITFKISLGLLLRKNIPQSSIWLFLQLYNISRILKCHKVSHDLFTCWGFFDELVAMQWAHVGEYLVNFNKPLRQMVCLLMCQRTEYWLRSIALRANWNCYLLLFFWKVSCFVALSRVHEK